jgi:hypothetical protein
VNTEVPADPIKCSINGDQLQGGITGGWAGILKNVNGVKVGNSGFSFLGASDQHMSTTIRSSLDPRASPITVDDSTYHDGSRRREPDTRRHLTTWGSD